MEFNIEDFARNSRIFFLLYFIGGKATSNTYLQNLPKYDIIEVYIVKGQSKRKFMTQSQRSKSS